MASGVPLASKIDFVAYAEDLDGDGDVEVVGGNVRAFWMDDAADVAGVVVNAEGDVVAFDGVVHPWDVDKDGVVDLILGRGRCGTPLQWQVGRPNGARGALMSRGPERPPPHGIVTDAALVVPLPGDAEAVLGIGPACANLDVPLGFLVGAPGDEARREEDLTPADAYWKLLPVAQGMPYTAMAPMGAAVADLDVDGLFDVLITLGDGWTAVLQGTPDGRFVDRTLEAGLNGLMVEEARRAELPWSATVVDLDGDGLSDVVITYGDDANSFIEAGYGRLMGLRAWRNRGGMVFEEITEALGLTAAGNWRSLVVDDPDEDGDADFIVGGTGYSPRVLRNDIDTGLHRFSLRLRGTASDALAMGAVVTVFGADVPPRRAVVGEHASPRATSVRTLFFGTGREPTAERVEIAWPSGYVQDVLDLPTGRLHVITEPPLLAVTPSSREVPADGVSVAEVRILPHDRAAQPMAAEVVFTLDGPGELVSVARDGLAWVATVRAPTSPGQARVRVTQDGRRWGIAPKLSWLAVQPADAP